MELTKRFLSMALAVLMILSTFPLSTLAEELKDGETESFEETAEIPKENEAVSEEGEFVPETEPETSRKDEITSEIEPEIPEEDTTVHAEAKEDLLFADPQIVAEEFCGGDETAGYDEASGAYKNLWWTLTDDGTLTIGGEGEMKSYDTVLNKNVQRYVTSAPWGQYLDQLKTLVIKNGVTSIGDYALFNCRGFTGGLVLPNSVASIGAGAFAGCSGFTGELVIPDGVTNIDYAFAGCSGFTGDLVIPDSVTSIGELSFQGCSGFNGNLVLSNNITSIGDHAFLNCRGFTGGLVIPNSVTSIGEGAFSGCLGFTDDLVLGNSVTSIGVGAFADCSGFTGDLIIPDSVTEIGSTAFDACSGFNGKLVLSKNLTDISDTVFNLCTGLTGTLEIPKNVKNIGQLAFFACSGLTGDLVIPEGVTSIGSAAFSGCDGLTGNVYLPESLTKVEDVAFDSEPFKNFYFKGNAPTVSKATNTWPSFTSDAVLYYLEGKSGWTSPTWNGYNTALWNGNPYMAYSENYVLRFDDDQIKTEKSEPFIYWNDSTFYVCVFSDEKLDNVKLISGSNDSSFGEPHLLDVGNIAETFNAKYGYVLEIPVSHNNETVDCKTFYFKISAEANGETYLSNSCNVISDVLFMDPEYVIKCVEQGDEVYIPAPAYSAYDVARNGYRNPINIAYGWVIGTTTFRSIAGEELIICLDDGLKIRIPEIAQGQKGVNFSYERMSNGRVGFSFFGQQSIASDFEIWWNSGITYGELRQLIYPDSSETDNLRFDVLKNGMPWDHISIDYSKVDADEIVEVTFLNNARHNPGTFEFVAAATVIDSGFCGGDTNAVYNADSGAYENLWWTLTDDGILTIGGEGPMMYYGVEDDAWITTAPWGAYEKDLKTLLIEDGVTSIWHCAFFGCSGFTGNLVIPNSVTSIGSCAFADCSGFTGDLVIPDSVTSIENSAFDGCSGFTGNLVISNNVTSIEEHAFAGCSGFTGDLVIGNNVTSIGERAFAGCSGFTGDLVIPDSVTNIGEYAFFICTDFDGKLVIGNSVTNIEEHAFADCSGLTGVLLIPDSVTNIGYMAFAGCSSLTGDLVIPDNVISLGDAAFFGCSGFTGNLVIGNSITSIGDYAFFDCFGFTGDLVIPNSVTGIGNYAFSGCSGFTGDLVFPNSVTSIGEDAFSGCSGFTGDLVLPNGITSIKRGTFVSCSGLTGNLVIPEKVETIGSYAFSGTNFVNIYFKGNTPEVVDATEDAATFNPDVTLYYIDGKTGWTSPTWNGYNTALWEIPDDGDINEDGKINVLDANIVRRAAAKLITLNSSQKLAADVNGDGSVDVIDANLIRRYAARLIDSFSVGN